MMMQLSPSIPVEIIGMGTGQALGWIDYSEEYDLFWVVGLDSDGTIWTVDNKRIRLIKNISLGRTFESQT